MRRPSFRRRGGQRVVENRAPKALVYGNAGLAIAPAAVPHAVGALGVTDIDGSHAAIGVAARVIGGGGGCSASAALIAGVAAPMSDSVVGGHQIGDTLSRARAVAHGLGWRWCRRWCDWQRDARRRELHR